jgi:hypothetical protein
VGDPLFLPDESPSFHPEKMEEKNKKKQDPDKDDTA